MGAFAVVLWSIMLSLLRTSPVFVRAFAQSTRRVRTFSRPATLRLFAVEANAADDALSSNQQPTLEPMANIYQEWTLEQDEELWESRNESAVTLAALLGRGLRGVETRLSKLKDVNSSAYQRLFADQANNNNHNGADNDDGTKEKKKLIPASEVLRRIKWDASLSTSDFSILHYDRVEDKVVESQYDAPNNSIKGPEKDFVNALPEHRIVGIKYRDRVVWDREKRIDQVFSNEGIEQVMANYDDWKQKKDEAGNWNMQRQAQVSERLQQILGVDIFAQLKELSALLLSSANDETVSTKIEVENYVQGGLELFQQAREDPSVSLASEMVPLTDYYALDCFSELVALLPDPVLRPIILRELSSAMSKAEGKKVQVSKQRELPVLQDEDLTETFIRGSGPGGQKINKTSNRVLLVHEPTQLRVECQDTRSLQQNRKIARKRLQLKLDEHIFGSQSKASLAAKKASSKKAKNRSKAKQRQRKKKEDAEEQEPKKD